MRAQRTHKLVENIRLSRGDLIVALLLCTIGVASRLLPHAANFAPALAIAVFSGFYFRRRALGWVVPLVMIIVSDLFLGMYAIAPFIWGSYVVMAFAGQKFMRKGTMTGALAAGIGSAVWFYLVTNFVVWAEWRMYPPTMAGLVDCYVAALPFFRPTLISAVLYCLIFFGAYHVVARGYGRRSVVASRSAQ